MTARKKRPPGRPPSRMTLRLRALQAAVNASTGVSTDDPTTVAAPGAGAAPENVPIAPRGRARPEAAAPAFPKHRVARVADLVPYERNARTHGPAQIAKLCRLIKEFGWTNPMLVAGRHILAGHARHEAAMNLGLLSVPVIDLSHLSAVQRRAFILADNKSPPYAGWGAVGVSEGLCHLRDPAFPFPPPPLH